MVLTNTAMVNHGDRSIRHLSGRGLGSFVAGNVGIGTATSAQSFMSSAILRLALRTCNPHAEVATCHRSPGVRVQTWRLLIQRFFDHPRPSLSAGRAASPQINDFEPFYFLEFLIVSRDF